jgi:hypothetical protein
MCCRGVILKLRLPESKLINLVSLVPAIRSRNSNDNGKLKIKKIAYDVFSSRVLWPLFRWESQSFPDLGWEQ